MPARLETTLADCVEKYRSAAIERSLNSQLSRANAELRTLNATLDKAREEALAATRAKSEPGVGSCFTVTLPFRQTAPSAGQTFQSVT